jgi:hypothetical protein
MLDKSGIRYDLKYDLSLLGMQYNLTSLFGLFAEAGAGESGFIRIGLFF